MFFPTRFFRFLYSSSFLSRWINFTIRRFFTFFESGSLCAAAIWRSSISTPASEPTSFTVDYGLHTMRSVRHWFLNILSLDTVEFHEERIRLDTVTDLVCRLFRQLTEFIFKRICNRRVFIEVSRLAFNTLESSYGSVIFLGNKFWDFCIASLG